MLREIWDLVSDPKKLQIRLVGDQITKARFTEDSGFPEFLGQDIFTRAIVIATITSHQKTS